MKFGATLLLLLLGCKRQDIATPQYAVTNDSEINSTSMLHDFEKGSVKVCFEATGDTPSELRKELENSIRSAVHQWADAWKEVSSNQSKNVRVELVPCTPANLAAKVIQVRYFHQEQDYNRYSFFKEGMSEANLAKATADGLKQMQVQRAPARTKMRERKFTLTENNFKIDVLTNMNRIGLIKGTGVAQIAQARDFLILHEFGHIVSLEDTKTVVDGNRVPMPGQPLSVMNGHALALTKDDKDGIVAVLRFIKEGKRSAEDLCGPSHNPDFKNRPNGGFWEVVVLCAEEKP